MPWDYAPRLWFDKVCINQCDIQRDLECLPIFVAGCNSMLVLSGRTYTSRLWCVMELFVYISMRDARKQESPDIFFLGVTHDELVAVQRSWLSFDAEQCCCFNPADKARIMSVIKGSDNGISGFNKRVVAWARILVGTDDSEVASESDRASVASNESESYSVGSIGSLEPFPLIVSETQMFQGLPVSHSEDMWVTYDESPLELEEVEEETPVYEEPLLTFGEVATEDTSRAI